MGNMSIFARTKYSLKYQGLKGTLSKLPPLIVDYLFDFKYGIDTCKATELQELTIESPNNE